MVTSVREGLSPENADLLAKMDAIGPWHMNVRINEELNTGMTSAKDSEKSLSPSLLNKEKHFKSIIRRAYPEGLAGKSFSDHACNSGGYCFWAKDVGAASTFGYDVRDHWINQANFIKAHRSADNANMRFEVM